MQIQPLYVRPALPGEDSAALKLLRSDCRSAEENLRQTALRLDLLEGGELAPDGILACIESATGQVVGCLLVQSDSPKSALAWPPGVADPARRAAIEEALFAGLREHAHFRRWTNVLAFLDEADAAGADSLVRGGFEAVTRVRELRRPAGEPAPPAERLYEWIAYADCDPEDFAEVFRRTLIDSLDCPELNDLRTPAEILAGYRESAPDTKGWSLIRYRDIDIGTAILVEAPSDGETGNALGEIAFMGLIPEARGAGLGRQLLHEILLRSSQSNPIDLRVRCDERNLPAGRIYDQNGFQLQRSYQVLLMRQSR